MALRLALALASLALVGCAFGDGRGGDDAASGNMDAGAPTGTDAGPPSGFDAGPPTGSDAGPPTGTDAGPPTGSDAGPPRMDAGFDAGGATGGPLDPRVSLPDPGGAPCTTPGSMGECPGITVCRFFTSTEGRCESCGPCGNLNAFCSSSAECDILFMCFSGRCTNFCTLGSFECGPPADCIDIGHPTRGVCRP